MDLSDTENYATSSSLALHCGILGSESNFSLIKVYILGNNKAFHCYGQVLDEQIAHLKDQIQELKAKNALEAKHVRKECQVSLFP